MKIGNVFTCDAMSMTQTSSRFVQQTTKSKDLQNLSSTASSDDRFEEYPVPWRPVFRHLRLEHGLSHVLLARNVPIVDHSSYFHRLKPCKQIVLNLTHAMDTLANLGTNIPQSVLRL
jgi:hypothetical protein